MSKIDVICSYNNNSKFESENLEIFFHNVLLSTYGNGVFCGSNSALYFSIDGPAADWLLKQPGM